MNHVYSVVFEYAYPDIANNTLFVTLDKNEAIEKANALYLENLYINSSKRPILSEYLNVEFNDMFLDRIIVTEMPMGVDIPKISYNLPEETPRTKIVWFSGKNFEPKEKFVEVLTELFKQDLQMTPSEKEIDEIWALFEKDNSVFNTGGFIHPKQIHSAEILTKLKKEKEYSYMMDIENKLR